jgi:hypothetical protein
MSRSQVKIGLQDHRNGEPQLFPDDLRGSHSPPVMRSTEELDESSVAQLRTLFELLDQWEREVCGPHRITVGSDK